jgi:enoyl-CoA hydratase/carnithine racemase
MSTLEAYAAKYQHLRLERRNGILRVMLHSNGKTLRWGGGPHGELGPAFCDIGTHPDTKVVILTGTRASFSEEADASNVGQRLPTT